MKGRLADGFEAELNDNILDDWEFLELLDDVDNGNEGAIVRVAKMLLGKDGLKSLKDHLRQDGRVKVTAIVPALTELMESASQLKNS